MADRVYFRQLLSGRDFARGDPIATQMVNFTYLIGDRETGDALVVDPAYAVDELVDLLAADGMRLVGVLGTHWHPDHLGGSFAGHDVEGITRLLGRADVDARVHVQQAEADWVVRHTGASRSDLVLHDSGDTVCAGAIPVQLIHTPGHTPGSQCFFVDGRLVAGDTLFLDGCGRVDLPGADADAMYDSLTKRLAIVPDDAVLYPGHLYSPAPSAPMGAVHATNGVFRFGDLTQWRAFMGTA